MKNLSRRKFLKSMRDKALGLTGLTLLNGCSNETPTSPEDPLPDPLNQIDCDPTNSLKIAFVLLGKSQSDFTDNRLNLLEEIKNQTPAEFNEATWGMSQIDTSYPIYKMIADSTTVYSDNRVNIDQTALKFYENNPDEFDFIAIYPTFFLDSGGLNNLYHNLKNNIKGIGLHTFSDQLFRNKKLRGATTCGGSQIVRDYATNLLLSQDLGVLLHEIGHQWGVFAGSHSVTGPELRYGPHFYPGLESHDEDATLMMANHWVPNGDGTYHKEGYSGPGAGPVNYHPFMLYFMGLLNKDNYDFNKKFKIVDCKGGTLGPFNSDNAPLHKEISINDIIAVEGKRYCTDS